MNKKPYVKPETGVVVLPDRLMLELPVSEDYVDDEAAKGYSGYEDDDSFETTDYDLWGGKD